MSQMIDTSNDQDIESDELKLVLRNYRPLDPSLEKFCLEPLSVLEETDHIDAETRIILENAKNSDSYLTSLEQKKVNWDLKRDIAPKLEILHGRYKHALVEMVREKIQSTN